MSTHTVGVVPDSELSSPRGSTTGFLDLSPELRNEIYRLSLRHPEILEINLHSFPRPRKSIWGLGAAQKGHLIPSLLRVSKQIHSKARTILYGENVFSFKYTDDVQYLLRNIGDNAKYVRCVEVSSVWTGWKLKFLAQAPALERVYLGPPKGWERDTATAQKAARAMMSLVPEGHTLQKIVDVVRFVFRSKRRRDFDLFMAIEEGVVRGSSLRILWAGN